MEGGRTDNYPYLHFRCFNQRLDVMVSFSAYLGSQGIAVRYRFDQQEAQSQTWTPATDGRAVFAPETSIRSFTDRVAASKRLLFEAATFQGVRYRAVFDLAAIDQVLPEIAACRQPPRPAQVNQTRQPR